MKTQPLIAQIPNVETQIIGEMQKAADFGSGVMFAFIGGFLMICLVAWLFNRD